MTEIKLTKEYMDSVIIKHGMIPMDFKVESCNQQIHYMDKEGYKYNYSWSQFPRRVNTRPIQKISQSNIYSIDNIKLYIKNKNIKSEILSDKFTKVTDWNLKFSCEKCNSPFDSSWNNFKRRHYYLCDDCLTREMGVYKDRKDKNEVMDAFKKIGLIIKDIEEYKGSNKNIDCYDKDGYKYSTRYANVTMNKKPNIVHPTNPHSIENIQNYLKLNKSKTIILSKEYKDEKGILNFRCGECGELFDRSWANLNGVKYHSCEKCQIINRGKSRRMPIEEVIKRFEEMELKLLDLNYSGNSKRLLCEDKYGYRGYVCYNSKQKIEKSCRTGFDYFSIKHNKQNFIHNANKYCENNDIKTRVLCLHEKSLYTTPTIECLCGCGEKYITSIGSFKATKVTCDKCSNRISSYEQMVINYLRKNKIKFISQKIFPDCRNILPLPFDFYLKDINTLIEVDGQGHYQICYFNGCSYESGKKSHERTIFNDKIKTKYCEENGINLIRIPYWEMDDNTYIEKLNQSILNLAD